MTSCRIVLVSGCSGIEHEHKTQFRWISVDEHGREELGVMSLPVNRFQKSHDSNFPNSKKM